MSKLKRSNENITMKLISLQYNCIIFKNPNLEPQSSMKEAILIVSFFPFFKCHEIASFIAVLDCYDDT